MARIGPKGSKPEMIVRRCAHALGFRFRLHRADLPGTPDLIFPSLKKAVFVPGCWWHQPPGCKKASGSKTQAEFWQAKFARNIARDQRVEAELRELNWKVLTIWECQARHHEQVRGLLLDFLSD